MVPHPYKRAYGFNKLAASQSVEQTVQESFCEGESHLKEKKKHEEEFSLSGKHLFLFS